MRGREVDNLLPSNDEGENEWSCTYTPPICFRGTVRENFTFALNLLNIYSMQHDSVSFLLQNLQLIAHDLLSVLNFSRLGLSKQLKLSGGNRNFIACLVILPVYPDMCIEPSI